MNNVMTAEEQEWLSGVRSDMVVSREFYQKYDPKDKISISAQWFRFNDREREILIALIDRLSAALKATNTELQSRISPTGYAAWNEWHKNNGRRIDELEARLAKAEKRVEAAISDLNAARACDSCKHLEICPRYKQWKSKKEITAPCLFEWNDPTADNGQ